MTSYDRISEKLPSSQLLQRMSAGVQSSDEGASTSGQVPPTSGYDPRPTPCAQIFSEQKQNLTPVEHQLTHGKLPPKFLDLLELSEPKLHYEPDFNMKILKKLANSRKTQPTNQNCPAGQQQNQSKRHFLASTAFEDSGYQSLLTRSQCSQYGTGWLMVDSESLGSGNSADEWDGFMVVNEEKVKIKDMSDLLAMRYAVISGAKTAENLPIVTFPDTRVNLSHQNYRRLIAYLMQVPPFEDTFHGNVVVIDRRLDKWAAVKTLLVHISNFFPKKLLVVYVLKPEGVLQRALERGYKSTLDSCRFQIIICQTVHELYFHISPKNLTFDLDGRFKYNHLEWVQNRMDIERMRASSQLIAKSLEEFSRCLRDTELPNDAESTEAIIMGQKAERDSIKEDFRIAVRRGFSLLKNVRQADLKPTSDLLSPSRLQNVTTIERMLIQLEETEKSFDKFWTKHEQRLHMCLQLRRFEDDFRKLQANFAQHMLYLEENREVGDTADAVNALISVHESYMTKSEDDIKASEILQVRGNELLLVQEKELLEGSLKPKCGELCRMKDALQNALQRRLEILRLSKQMHEQISVANTWCSKGVDLLTSLPLDTGSTVENLEMQRKLEDFLAVGKTLQLDSLRLNRGPELKALILMTTTDSSALINQVSVRIADIKRMCESRKVFLHKFARSPKIQKPIGAVSPQTTEAHTKIGATEALIATSPLTSDRKPSTPSISQPPSTLQDSAIGCQSICEDFTKTCHIIDELLCTEKIYVDELTSIVQHYVEKFEFYEFNSIAQFCESKYASDCTVVVNRNLAECQKSLLFGNLREILNFHVERFYKDLLANCQHANNVSQAKLVARCFLNNLDFFYLYNIYCQNKPRSDSIRAEIGENHPYFYECQRSAGHMLPLGSYLLKPVQRITKYQLLLKVKSLSCPDSPLGPTNPLGPTDFFGPTNPYGPTNSTVPPSFSSPIACPNGELAKSCKDTEDSFEVEQALASMLDLLRNLNASMHQTFISGYPGDLTTLGRILLQAKFSVWQHKKHSDKTLRLRRAKVQNRHVFLYPHVVLFCKCRRQSPPYSQEFYEFKSHLSISSIGLTEHVKGHPLRFELWTEGRHDVFVLQPVDHETRNEWVTKMKSQIAESFYALKEQSDVPGCLKNDRPVSWTSQTSTGSSRSSREFSSAYNVSERGVDDSNNNPTRPKSLRSVSDESVTTSQCSDDPEPLTLVISPQNGNFATVRHLHCLEPTSDSILESLARTHVSEDNQSNLSSATEASSIWSSHQTAAGRDLTTHQNWPLSENHIENV